MAWKFNGNLPVYVQIKAHIKGDIINGTYKIDEQIPSVRQLALEAAVNPNTVQRALAELEEEGILVSRRTLGRFVTADENALKGLRDDEAVMFIEETVGKAKRIGMTKGVLIKNIEEREDWN